jgi:signal transduction histidine kinase
MNTPVILLTIFLLLGAFSCLWVANSVLRRRRRPVSVAFGLSMIAASHWAFFYWLEILVPTLGQKTLLAQIEYIGIVGVSVFWLIFAAELEGFQQWTRWRWRWIAGICLIPIITLLMVFTNSLHGAFWAYTKITFEPNLPPMFQADYGWWFYVHVGYSYLLLLASTILFGIYLFRRHQTLYIWQLAMVMIAVLVPWGANGLFFAGIRPLNADLTPTTFAISGLILAWSVFRFRFLEVVPIARQKVLDNVSDAVMLFDALGQLIDVNPAARRILNIGNQDPIGKSVRDILRFNEPLLNLYQRTEQFPAQAEVFFYAPDERPDVPFSLQHFDVRINSIVSNDTDRELGRLLLLHNITARKEMEDALRRNQEELERRVEERTSALQQANDSLQLEVRERQKYEAQLMTERSSLQQKVDSSVEELRDTNARLERELRRKDEILAMLNHELRTPLNAILGMTQYLKSGSENATRQQQALDTVEQNGLALLQMVNDLLDLANLSLGELRIENTPVVLDQVCRSSLQAVQLPALEKNITVRYVPDDRVQILQGDANYLRRVLVHLLQNAVKFTPKNGKIALGVRAYPEAQRVHVVVGDTGVGIEPSELPYLFKPFAQVERGITRKYSGLGVGLVLVKRLVEMHKGEISVNSKPGQGTYFTIALPWQ